MSRLKASLVVSLTDKTAAGARSVRRNLTALEAAQKRLENKRRLGLMTSQDLILRRAMDEQARFSFERDRVANMRAAEMQRQLVDRRRRQMVLQQDMAAAAATTMRVASVATAATAYVAAKAVRNYAQLERQINRVVLNADKGKEAIKPTLDYLMDIGKTSQLGLDGAVTGLETLIASGRSLDDALAFLPSVALTAQASGAAIEDVALSADSLSGSMKIGAADMQKAFDILVAGGKAGKFELKDMSQYLPSLLPAFAALGYEGTEGLQKMVAMLQIMRNQAGSAGEAATYLGNVMQKMHSEETAKKFSKMGVNITKALSTAKKEGKDVLDVFLDMTELAIKGDLSKLTRLFTDSELQKGVRALITQRRELEALNASLGKVDGSAMKDFQQVINDTEGSIEKLSASWDKLWTKLGEKTSKYAVPLMDGVTDILDDADARARGLQKTTGGDRDLAASQEQEYKRRYNSLYPDNGKNDFELSLEYNRALELAGRGAVDSVMEVLDAVDRARKLAQHYRHGYQPGKGAQGLDATPSTGALPVPGSRPAAETEEDRRNSKLREAYSQGTGREAVAGALKTLADYLYDRDGGVSVRPEQKGSMYATDPAYDGETSVRPWQRNGGAGEPGILDDLDGSTPVDLSTGGPREVTLMGTPTVISQPSGTQQVQVMNPTPMLAPISVSVSVHATSNADPAAIGQQVGDAVGQKIKAELAGIQADTGWEVA
ncbi:phage tail tape measure protein [Shinella sp.]|uniref:phage tail tape measure protein n=1 Tax=Shinella sp. TaxID=1870904 RepID=UPI003F71D35A